jgi:DNA-binding NarL/FixJ family response regulator
VSDRIRVLVADDHPPTRSDICQALEDDGRFLVCADVPDAVEAVETALRERPDLCLLDVRMPGGGVSAAWEITARLPDTKVVMLTVSNDEDDLFAAIRSGAAGYLLKDLDPASLGDELAAVLDGEAAMSRRLLTRVLEEFRDRGPRRRHVHAAAGAPQLTSREWEVLGLMRSGLGTAEIADRLFLSTNTVRSHIAAILRKLRVPDRQSALELFAIGDEHE